MMKKTSKKILCIMLGILMIFASVNVVLAKDTADGGIKNIIYMIPDGGGMASFYLADAVKQAGGLDEKFPVATPAKAEEMHIKQYLVGAETTYSANAEVTDSAASGTALSSGYKTNNGMIGISPDMKPHANILEACQELGKNTGLVATFEWSHATPAAFSAHAQERGETVVLAEQIVNQGIDVVFGNTLSEYSAHDWFADENFEKLGYDVIKTKEELANVKAGDRAWGKMPQVYFDTEKAADAPNLAELTEAAIRALDDGNKEGFFLMVEGSTVDLAGHNSDAVNVAGEYIAFDEACKVAIEFAKKRNDTLVVILPDHDTGGVTHSKDDVSAIVADVQSGVNSEKITWEGNGSHTDRNGGIFIYLPEHIEYPEGIDPAKAEDVAKAFSENVRECEVNRIDNTGIAQWLSGIIGVDLNLLTEELFVDVTDMGVYFPASEKFIFSVPGGRQAEIEKDSATAKVDGKKVDLGGRVALFINERFYVPKMLVDMVNKVETDKNATPAFIVDKKYIKEPVEEEKEELPQITDPAVKGHWAESYLTKAVADGLIKGSDKGIEPDRNVTKAELITMIMRALNIENDTSGEKWYSYAANKALELGWTNDISDIEMDINRAASAGIMANAKKIDNISADVKAFADETEISATGYLDAVMKCVSGGLITGYPDGTFRPVNTITRSEAVVILQRAFYAE